MSEPVESKKETTKCILVLGMHRSGTSAATRCLNMLGMDVGSHLLTPDDVNSKGYWEHADAVRINDALLEAFGLSWWSLSPLPDGWLTSEAANEARREIEQFVRRDFSNVPLWGVKDPRLCRTAPLWIEVLAGMGISVSAMFIARAPREVALSLSRAQGLSIGAGLLLWMQHLAESERATRDLRRVMITYDQLLDNPLAALESVGETLQVAWPILPAQRVAALGAFLDLGLRNHKRLSDADDVPALARLMDAASRSIAQEHHADVDWSALSHLSDRAVELMDMMEYRSGSPLPDEVIAANTLQQLQTEQELACLYWTSPGQAFAEDRSVASPVPFGRSEIDFPLPVRQDLQYRLDPSNNGGLYVLHAITVVDDRHRVVWSWFGNPGQADLVRIVAINRPSTPESVLHVMKDDPHLLFSWPEGLVHEGFLLRLDIERLTPSEAAVELEAFEETLSSHSRRIDEASAAFLQQERVSREKLVEVNTRQQSVVDALRASEATQRKDYEATVRRLSDERDVTLSQMRQQLAAHSGVMAELHRGQQRQEDAMTSLLRRGLWSYMRRRLARTEFRLFPRQHLDVINPAERRYRVTGNDPIFICDSENYPLTAGWYKITLDMQQHSGMPAQACLYPDYGSDIPSDPAGVSMPFVRSERSLSKGLVRFAHPVKGLRFDPANAPCEISVSRLMIQRVTKLRAGWELLKAWRNPLATVGKPRPAWRSIVRSFRDLGLAGGIGELYRWYTTVDNQSHAYDAWVTSFDDVSPTVIDSARTHSREWSHQPLISVLVPSYNTDEPWLRRCLDSVLGQAYPHWELCVADDASSKPHVMTVLNEYASKDPRIRVTQRSENGHISASSNTALEMARGQYVALLDHDDELHPLALHEIVAALQKHPQWKLIYSDEDKIDEQGHRYDPYMKPDWNYDLLLSQNCISHLGVYQRELMTEVGGFRQGFEGSQDWDLALRCIEKLKPEEIGHVARVLYHWRAIPGSTSMGVDEKGYTRTAALKAIGEHLERVAALASVEEIKGRPGNFRVRYCLPEKQPKVSLIIPTRDGLHLLQRCVDSILTLTDYDNYEIVIVDNQSEESETHAYFSEVSKDPRVRVMPYDEPFNYSAINNHAVSLTDGELIGLVNNDIEVISPGWLGEMTSQAMRPGVGAVGAMLYYPNDTIQHAGVVLGVHGVAAHSYCGKPRGYPGQMGRARLVQELSAVTAACLVVRRDVFEKVHGLDESLQVAFNDIDLCLRIRQAGYRNLWTPFAELYHHESATRGHEDSPEKVMRFTSEVNYMLDAWKRELVADPAYSPNLAVTDEPFSLAFPPRHLPE